MTREEIIAMAREAGLHSAVLLHLYAGKEAALTDSEHDELRRLERFANLIEQRAVAAAKPRDSCNPHPKAPHGFCRNASHAEDRYVCECESWDPWDAGYEQGVMDTLLEDKP